MTSVGRIQPLPLSSKIQGFQLAKKIKLKRAHGLDKAAAVERMRKLTDELHSKYGLKVTHMGDSTRVKGKGADGTASCDATYITIELKLGLPASLAAGRIEIAVGKALTQHFS